MKKYKTLESLSEVIIFIAWLFLIGGILGTLYILGNELKDLYFLAATISCVLWFVLLLGFGKLIQLSLDIRAAQIELKDGGGSGSEEEIIHEPKEISETVVSELSSLIKQQKNSFLSDNAKMQILSQLKEVVTSQERAKFLMEEYYKYQGRKLEDDLRKLTTNYAGIKEYLQTFIDFKILNEEYPHNFIDQAIDE